MENPAPESAILKGKWQALKVPPGSTLDRGMWKEKRTDDRSSMGGTLNSGDPVPLPSGNRRDVGSQRTGDADAGIRESDPLIVVRDGNAGHRAKERAGSNASTGITTGHDYSRTRCQTPCLQWEAVLAPCVSAGSVCALS